MKKNYNHIIGKTKKEVIFFLGGDQFNDPHSDKWTFFINKNYLGRKKYLHVIFEAGIVVQVFLRVKNFWE